MHKNKFKNTHKFSKVHNFTRNWFQLDMKFLIDIKKYFRIFKDVLIIVQIQMENI